MTKSESPEPLEQVAAIVAGAGLAGTVQGFVKGFAPTLTPEIAGAVGGGLLYYFGDRINPLVKAAGVGILAGSLSPMIAKMVSGVLPAGGGGGGSSGGSGSSNPQTDVEAAALSYVLRKKLRA